MSGNLVGSFYYQDTSIEVTNQEEQADSFSKQGKHD